MRLNRSRRGFRKKGIVGFEVFVLAMGLGLTAGATDSGSTRVLSITEIPELGSSDFSICLDSAPACVSDYKSILEINPNLSALVPSGGGRAQALSPVIQGKREDLLGALREFTESMKISVTIVRDCPRVGAAGRSSAQEAACKELSENFEKHRKALLANLEQYIRRDPEAFGLQLNPGNKEVRRKLGDAYFEPAKTGEWIAARLSELDSKSMLAAAELKDGLTKLRVRMGAFQMRSGKPPAPLHLDNFDNFESKSVKPVDRISFEVSEDQAKRLEEEGKFNQAAAKQISGLRDGSSDFLRQVHGQIAELKNSSVRIQRRLEGGLALFQGKARSDLSGIVTALRAKASASSQQDLDQLEIELRKAQERLSAYKATLDASKAILDGLEEGASPSRPDFALITLLRRVDTFQNGLKSAAAGELAESIKSMKRAQGILRESSGEVGALGLEAKEQLAASKTQFLDELLRISSDVENIATGEIARLVSAVEEYKGSSGKFLDGVGPIVDVKLSDPAIFSIAGDKARATTLDLARSGIDSGDSIEFSVEVEKDGAKGVIHQEHKIVQIEKYGWSSNIVGGLGFVRGESPSQANFEPAPTMTWLLSRKNRPEEGGFKTVPGVLGMGFGIHTITLDFDQNVSVEAGMGASIHFFRNLLQLGYGVNLSVQHRRQYFFVGLRLFQMLK